MKRKILLVLVVIFVVAQFFQPSRNSGTSLGAQDITHSVAVPPSVMEILQKSCFDCHSNHTNYPWYSRINPVSWWLNGHIEEGKRELNFSIFSTYSAKKQLKKIEQTAELVATGKMPLNSYTWIHTETKLNDAQRQIITDWANSLQSDVSSENH